MERATQERLVGATLLIVTGVILIPWLLDGSMTGPGGSEQELVLPGSDDSGNETRRISLDVPRQEATAAGSTAREIDSRSVRDADEQTPAMNLPTPKTREASSTVAPARFAKPMPATAESTPPSTVATEARELEPERTTTASVPVKPAVLASSKDRSAKPTSPADTGTAAEVPASSTVKAPETAPGEQAWAVQVGSFASQENAERLAERLRGKSYKAFVMRNVIEGRVRFRVRVGPVVQRSEAELLAAALREDRQPARILSHP